MPKYIVNGKMYNIPDDKIEGFERKYPDANIEYNNEGKTYHIPISKRDGFLKQYPNAVAGTFTGQTEPQPMFSATATPFKQNNSVAPTTSEKPEEEKVQLSFTTPQRPQLKSLQVEQKEYPTIAETTQKKMAEGVAQRQQLSDMTTNVQKALNRRGSELDEAQKANKQSYIPQGTAGSIPAFDAGRMYDPEYRDYAAAKESLQNAQAIIDAAGKEAEDKEKGHTGIGGFFKGALRGAGESFGDINTWSAGLKDSSEGLALLKALEAAEEGTLTPSQQALLDAKAIELAVEQNYSSSLGRGYKAGQVTAESLPFMMEFAFNPIAGAGNTIANRFARYALNRFGKQTVKKNAGKYLAGKALSHVATDALKAGAITATTGAGRTAADALQRMQGDIYYQPNEEGKVAFWKREGGEDAATAFKKAYANTTIENFSEMLGNYFAPIGKAAGVGVSKGLSKVGLDNVNTFFRDVKANDLAQLVADFEKRAQWNGTIGEFGEEVAGNILNSIIVGDQTLDAQEGTGVFNKENLIDTYLGVALLGGGLSAAKTIDYPLYKYYSQKNIRNAQLDFDDAFGKDEEALKINEALTSDDPRIAGEALRNILGNDDFTQEQQETAAELATTVQKYKGAQLFYDKRQNDPETPIEEVEVAESYDNGRNLETPQEKNDAYNMYEYQAQNMRRIFGLDEDADVDAFIGDDPYLFATTRRNENPEDGQAVLDYLNAKATMDGLYDQVNDTIDQQIEQSNKIIDSRKNNDDAMIHPATMRLNDREVYIISGRIKNLEDGTIDTANSDESIIIMDAETGNREFTTAADIKQADAPIDAEQEKMLAAETITNTISDQAERDIEGVLPFNVGDPYTILDDQGVQHTVTIVADNGDGTVQMRMDNEQQDTTAKKDDVQAMFEAYNLNRLNTVVTAKKEQETKVAESSIAPTSEQAVEQAEPKPRIPLDEQGEPMYEAAPVYDTWTELLELNEGNEEEAIDTANAMRENAQAELDKAMEAPKVKGKTVPEIQAAKAQQKALIKQAQDKLNYWTDVANYRDAQLELMKRAEQRAAIAKAQAASQEKGRYSEENTALGAPIDFRDYVMRSIATGGVRFIWKDSETGTRGLGSHTGLKSNEERNARIWLLNNENGLYPEEAAEQLLTSYAEELGYTPNIDTSDALSEILDVVSSYATPSSMFEAAQVRHAEINEQNIEQEAEDAYYRYKQAEAEANGMTLDEWLDYEEYVLSQDLLRFEENYDGIIAIFVEAAQVAETLNNNNNESSRDNEDVSRRVHQESGLSDGRETSVGVLQTEQMDNGIADSRGAEAGQGSDAQVVEPSTNDIPASEVSAGAEKVDNGYNGRSLTTDEAKAVVNAMQQNAIVVELLDLTPENWIAQFGEDGIIDTPIGNVKMGENQYFKLAQKGREGKLGMIKPTLQSPDIIVEEKSSAKNGQTAERNSSYVFVKAFTNTDGSRNYLFTSVTIRKDGKEVVISNQEKETPRIERLLKEGKLAYISEATLPSESTNSTQGNQSTILGGAILSESKDTTSEPQKQEIDEKNVATEQEADISDEDIEALWIKSRDELWRPNDEIATILNDKLYEAHPEAHQPADRKKVVRHLIEAAEKYKDHPIAKEVLKYVKYPKTISMRVSPLTNREEMRRKPLRARAKMWEAKVGVPVHLIETFEEVPTKDARKAILDGKVVTAWVTDGEVYLYMPYLRNRTEVDKTYIHEVVAHVGMKRLLGKEGYRQFCMRVYNEVMTEADRKFYDAYPNVKDHAQAADEYIAHLSEDTDMESSIWQKVVRIFRDALRVLGIETALTNKDIQDMLRDSYKNLTNEENVSISESEGTQLRSVYHGSGAEFDKFDHLFMGTGEGHQAFGWGTYVTEVEGIGKQYAKMTSKPRLTFKGEFVDSEELNNPWRIIKDLYDSNHGKLRGMRNDAERIAKMVEPDNAEMKDLWDNVVRTLSEVRSGDLKITPARYLYSVEIPDNDGTNYLEYGKPLSKTQLNRIKQALYNRLIADTYKGAEQELKEELDDVFAVEKELDGRDIYGTIATYLGSDKAASEFLNENGYVGISYPADGGNAGKARNYVIFNESDLEIKDSTRFRVKEKAPETASVQKEHQPTVVSSADGTKVLKKIDSAIEEYENKSNYPRTLLGDIAKVLNARKQGSNSQYAIFEAKNGKVFTIRLADHNAKVSTFDIHNEKDGISIIITAKSNEGIQNDGDAHIVEYFYDSIKLRKADGKPLVEILKSIKQTLYSGEYKDTTGLAEREEVNIRDGVRFRVVEPAPTFYSNAERAAENVKQEKATPEQWLKMIEKNGGLKAGEDKWLGLSDWLKSSDKKTLTKQEVLDFIKENQIQIEEVEYAENPQGFEELKKEYDGWLRDGGYDYAWDKLIERYGYDSTVAFDDVGGELVVQYGNTASKLLGGEVSTIKSTRLDYTTNGLDNKREIALTVPTIESWNESDEIHFGDAGNGRAIAWIRFGETTDADGNRVLVIDEVQSKRHQEGRERGYAKTEANDAFVAYRDQMMDKYGIEDIGSIYGVLNTEDKIEFDKLRTAANVEFRNSSDIPSAPFEKNWAELAMKRLLRYAAENGFDKIAWTTGDQQAERYDISKSVDNIKSEDNNVEETADGTLIVKNITIYAGGSVHNLFVHANGIVRGHEYDGKKLSDIVGKPLAEKLMEQGDFELEGDGLRIGGEGMKAFYDQMIPSFMNKYGKKWGVKVGEVTMPSLEENNTMHSIDVTDAMRESVMQGQPMFRFIGEVGATNLDKAEEATTRLDNLAIAREMEAADKSAKSIKMATGWERGADGKWRYEVDDVELKISPSQVFDDLEEKDLYLFDVLSDESFDKLIAEYPELGDVALSMDVPDEVGYASWDDEKHYILVTQNAYKYPDHLPSAIVHELQHAIQKIEGFAYGSNPLAMMRDIIAEKYGDNYLAEVAQEDKDGSIAFDLYNIRNAAEGLVRDGKYKYLRNAVKFVANTYIKRGWISSRTVQYFGNIDSTEELVNYIANTVTDGTLSQWQSLPIDIRDGMSMAVEKYMRTSGEVEARNASARMGMTIDERRESLAVDTEDVARKDQIFIYDALGENNSMFRISDYDRQFDALQSEYDALDKNDAKALNEWREKKTGILQSYMNDVTEEFNLPVKESYVYDPTNEDDTKRIYDAYVAALDRRGITSPIAPYEEFNAELQELDAAYREDADIIVANRNSMENSEQDVFEAIMHEQTHGVVSRIISTRALRGVWEEGKAKKPEFASVIENEYKGEGEERWGDEFLTYYLVRTLFSPRVRVKAEAYIKGESKITAEKFVKHTQDLLPLTNDALKQILNFYKDEYQKKTIHGFRSESSRGSEEIRGGIQQRVVSNARTERERGGAERGIRGRVLESANALAASLGVKLNVVDAIPNAPKGVKGRYSISTDQVYFVLPNATSVEDAKRTVLHEVVAHKGLRDVVGRDHFEEFLGKVFRAADTNTRRKIVALAARNGWDFNVATEEYLASLAEQGFDSRENRTFLQKVRDLFMDMFRAAKIVLGFNINDNDMRYMLWRTYQMQRSNGIMSLAEDVVMQRKLGVGNYRNRSMTEREQIIADAKANGTYLKAPNGKDTNLTPDQWVTVRTDAFKKWFGDWENDFANSSMIVDENREPKVVWHGGDFAMGDFTPNGAMHFGTFDAAVTRLNDKLYGGEVRVEQNADGEFLWEYEDFDDEEFNLRGDKSFASKEDAYREAFSKLNYLINPYFLNIRNIERTGDAVTDWADVVEASKEDGYDGIVYLNDYEDNGSDSYIAFTPTQIKSAEGNTTFDANNDDIRFRVAPSTPSTGKARQMYDEAVRSHTKKNNVKKSENLWHHLREAYQDSMLSVQKLMDAVLAETGNTLRSSDDVYKAENQLSSKNKAEIEKWERDFMKPLQMEILDLTKKGVAYDDIVEYLLAKHGLERNLEFSRREAEEDGKVWDGFVKRDFSGLTELTGEAEHFTEAAQQIVKEFEDKYNTDNLWSKINAATKESLKKSYDSGLMSKETYDKVANMFQYYIPLRGWDNNVAADQYEYMANKGMKILPALKTAKGRTSRADDPIATLGSVGESSIIQGNRNLMKQKFLNFAQNNPTSLLTVDEQWYEQNADGTWKPSNPKIPTDATVDEVDAIIKAHEAKMEALGNKATKKRQGLNINLHTTKWEQEEHAVNVKRNGKEYKIFVNGNPIAAQAINGFTNPNANKKDSWEWIEQRAAAVRNFMARAFTSMNPAFIFTNLARDLVWAGTSVAIKENATYTRLYSKNISKAMTTAQLPRLVSKWKKGTLDMSNPIEKYFHEFVTNGGETGFTQLNTVDDYKRNMERFIKEAQGGVTTKAKKGWRWIWDNVEFLNRSAEDTTRFMVYLTSRQMGRPITESIANAKDITVNFNKKGRGTMGANVLGFAYIFFNATIQSLANFGKLIANHPKKTAAALATFGASGMIAPMTVLALQAMLSGDDDEPTYWDLPEWVRRNNIVIYVGGSGYVTIPLPHELRPFYGMGELAFSTLMGKEEPDTALAKAAAGFASLMPFDFTGNAGNAIVNFTPTIAQPLVQLVVNKDYFGTPIYRKTAFNEQDPEWTKAYKSTNQLLVGATEFLNELTGGDEVKNGLIDLNPAIIEHLYEGYLGGMGKTINQAAKTLSMLWDEDARTWRNVPVVSSFYQVSDERTSGSQVNREYYDVLDEAEQTEHLYRGYNKRAKMGSIEYAEKLNELINSDVFKRYQKVNSYKEAIAKMNTVLKEADPADREDIETRIMELKVDMLEELEQLNNR